MIEQQSGAFVQSFPREDARMGLHGQFSLGPINLKKIRAARRDADLLEFLGQWIGKMPTTDRSGNPLVVFIP